MRLAYLVCAVTLAACCAFLAEPAAQHAQESTLAVDVKVLKRWDLPDGIPPEILHARYIVLRLTLKNNGSEPVALKPESILLRDPKGKPIGQASSAQVTGDILETGAFKRSGSPGGIHGEVGAGYPGYPGEYPPYIGPRPEPEPGERPEPGGPGTIQADRGLRLRDALERERFKAAQVDAGKEATGLLYFKARKRSEASGSTLVIVLADGRSVSTKIP